MVRSGSCMARRKQRWSGSAGGTVRRCPSLSGTSGRGRQVHLYSAPSRTELGGNHTDHQQGFGLAAAVDLDLVAVACPGTDGYIRVKSRGFNKLDVIDLVEQGLQTGEGTHSASLIRGIAEGFQAQGAKVGGLDLYTTSDVLRGSGLSSSAAFEMECGCLERRVSMRIFGSPNGTALPAGGKYILWQTQRLAGSADKRSGWGRLCGFCTSSSPAGDQTEHPGPPPAGDSFVRHRYACQSQ